MHGRGPREAGGHVWQGACMAGGVCLAVGCAWWGECMAGKTAIAAGGTHPKGMHSCLLNGYNIRKPKVNCISTPYRLTALSDILTISSL